MKVAMLTYGSRGDVQPYVAVADQLRTNGHTVVFATPVNLAATVSDSGFEAASIPIDSQAFLSSEEGRQFLANGRTTTFLRRLAEEETAKRDGLDEALIAASAGADVVVTGVLSLTRAAAITERSGQPLVVLSTLPFEPTGDFPCPYLVAGDLPTRAARRASHRLFLRLFSLSGRANTAAMRRRLGASGRVPDVFRRLRRDATPIVHMISPQLLPGPRDWPDHCTLAGDVRIASHLRAAWGEAHLDSELLAWLDAGPPPVFMGFGSMPVLEPAASLRMIDDVAARCGVRALVGAGWSDLTAGERCGGRLFIASRFDHDRVLPRCSAAVHHGGAGTTHAALRAGLPAVVAHVFADQILWGRQVARRKVGVSIPYRKLDADRLTAALAPLLDDDVARRASSLADAMAHERGAAVASEAIERAAGLSCSSGWRIDPTTLRPVITDEHRFRRCHDGDAALEVLVALWKGRPEAAMVALEPLLAADSGYWRWRALRADIRRDLGEHDEAIADYEALVREHVDTNRYAVLMQHLGKAHFAAGHFEAAASCFERAVQMRSMVGADPSLVGSSQLALDETRRRIDRARAPDREQLR